MGVCTLTRSTPCQGSRPRSRARWATGCRSGSWSPPTGPRGRRSATTGRRCGSRRARRSRLRPARWDRYPLGGGSCSAVFRVVAGGIHGPNTGQDLPEACRPTPLSPLLFTSAPPPSRFTSQLLSACVACVHVFPAGGLSRERVRHDDALLGLGHPSAARGVRAPLVRPLAPACRQVGEGVSVRI